MSIEDILQLLDTLDGNGIIVVDGTEHLTEVLLAEGYVHQDPAD